MEDVSYCARNISRSDRPGHTEVIGPPIVLGLLLFTGLTALYFVEKRNAKKRFQRWCNSMEHDARADHDEAVNVHASESDTAPIHDSEFMNDFDQEVLQMMDISFNRASELVKIVAPAIWAIGLTSVFIGCHKQIFACIWLYRARPDINTGVTCFLAPAGLIFALSFGFVFQMVLEKHNAVREKVTSELSLLDQMITITTKFSWPDNVLVMSMAKAIKSELITTSMLVQNREASKFKAVPPPNIRVHIWDIFDYLHAASLHGEPHFCLNSILAEKLTCHLLRLNSICTDRMGALHTMIHPMKWAFLEFLGSMSVFGVMIVNASSSKMELVMCELTVFSVFMLFYVLADFDSPFNGFFRVDVSLIKDVVKRAESVYHSAMVDQRMYSFRVMTQEKHKSYK